MKKEKSTHSENYYTTNCIHFNRIRAIPFEATLWLILVLFEDSHKASILVLSHKNGKCENFIYYFFRNIRWLLFAFKSREKDEKSSLLFFNISITVCTVNFSMVWSSWKFSLAFISHRKKRNETQLVIIQRSAIHWMSIIQSVYMCVCSI